MPAVEPDLDAITKRAEQELRYGSARPHALAADVLALVGRVRDLEAELLAVRKDAFERFDDAVAAEVAKAEARVRDLEAKLEAAEVQSYGDGWTRYQAAEARVAQLEADLDRTLTSLQHTFGREEKNRARVQELEGRLGKADERSAVRKLIEAEARVAQLEAALTRIADAYYGVPSAVARAALVSAGQGDTP